MMRERPLAPVGRLQILAEFRHQLRLFLQFSEKAARTLGLHPQQHQLLLQIAGVPDKMDATIGYMAERLGLRHNTVVELSNRCEQAGLVLRKQVGSDRRCVVLKVTTRGHKTLDALSIDHARELNELGPQLIRTLAAVRAVHKESGRKGNRRSSEI